MAIGPVVTRGFGIGSVNLVVTRGYSAAAIAEILNADHSVCITFRDKRAFSPFRDKRINPPFRDKRVIVEGR